MKKFFLVMAASLLTLIVQAVPAIPTPFNFTQSDGTTITVTMVGDEWGHLFLTTDGLTVNRASDTSDFFYATSSGISQMRAHNVGQRSEAEQVFVAVQ